MIRYKAEINLKNHGYQVVVGTDGTAFDIALASEGNVRAAITLTPKELDSLIASLQAARAVMSA